MTPVTSKLSGLMTCAWVDWLARWWRHDGDSSTWLRGRNVWLSLVSPPEVFFTYITFTETVVGLYVNVLLLSSGFNQYLNVMTNFSKSPQYHVLYHVNQCSSAPVFTKRIRTDSNKRIFVTSLWKHKKCLPAFSLLRYKLVSFRIRNSIDRYSAVMFSILMVYD
jgi:hypothetical protein